MGLVRAELQVKVNFTFDYFYFCCYIKEEKKECPKEKLAGSSEKYYWNRKLERVKIPYWIMRQKETSHCYFLLGIGNICLISIDLTNTH